MVCGLDILEKDVPSTYLPAIREMTLARMPSNICAKKSQSTNPSTLGRTQTGVGRNRVVRNHLVCLEDINGEFTYIERVHSSTPSLMESVDRLVWGGYD